MVLLIIGLGCACDETKSEPKGSGEINIRQDGLNMKKAEDVLLKLNSWDKEELSIAESNEKNVVRKASGETHAWIQLHKEILEELGFHVRWDPKEKSYYLDDIGQTPGR